jgi:hypothetical protein
MPFVSVEWTAFIDIACAHALSEVSKSRCKNLSVA